VRLLLDTSVLIDTLRGRGAGDRLRELRAGGTSTPWICAINVEELYRGVREAEEATLRRFLGGFRLAPLGREEAELAGRWRRDFARRGVTLGQADSRPVTPSTFRCTGWSWITGRLGHSAARLSAARARLPKGLT
jgi:predicted nucleic acid-binding protein